MHSSYRINIIGSVIERVFSYWHKVASLQAAIPFLEAFFYNIGCNHNLTSNHVFMSYFNLYINFHNILRFSSSHYAYARPPKYSINRF